MAVKKKVFAGDLDRLIVVEQNVATKNEYGEKEMRWAPLFTLYAHFQPVRSFENMEAGQLTSTNEVFFYVRYHNGIKPFHRIQFEGQIYDIKGIEPFGRRHFTLIRAESKD